MFEKYEHEGKPFTEQIAMELIFKTYEGKPPIAKSTIIEEVYQIHEKCGGLPPRGESHEIVHYTVERALRQLESNGGATKEQLLLWRIHDQDILKDIRSDEQTYPKFLGTGKQEVYLYYYPTYRENAELKRPPVWKESRKDALWRCKIGETHDQDTETRTKQQGRVFPEKKVTALVMRTDDSKRLETIIHEILKMWGRWIENAEGDEWFKTSPAEVERIYNFLLRG